MGQPVPLAPFVSVAAFVRRAGPPSTPPWTRLDHRLFRVTNTEIRLLHRVAFGFHFAQVLIALALLALRGQ